MIVNIDTVYNKLKGDKMKIKIKFNGLGYGNYFQANILIYDNHNLVYKGKTYNGEVKLSLKKNKVYKVIAQFKEERTMNYIYIKDCSNYLFNFNHTLIKLNNPITFFLTDYYYNLPIERGELILWPKT